MASQRFRSLSGYLLCAFFLLFFGISQAQTTKSQKTAPVEPLLSGTTLAGKSFTLAAKKGEIVLVTFWATWCPTCRAEMPTFRKFYETNKTKGFELVTVSIDDNMNDITDYAKLSNWLTSQNQSFPSMWRHTADYKDSFGKIWATPSTFLIGRDGKIIESFKGAIKPEEWARIKNVIDTPQVKHS
jgi:cytochrome c biogenesis protein CcmG, thiol:disulfide interchange protein DsbE